jgi:hypothetical protein
MKISRLTETQIISILKEADAGMNVKDVVDRKFQGHRRSAQWRVIWWPITACRSAGRQPL